MNDVFHIMTTFYVLKDSPEGFVKVTVPQGTSAFTYKQLTT